MGSKQSAEMAAALALIFGPKKLTAAEASRQTGITKGAISKNAKYRAHMDAKRGDKQDEKA